MSWNFLKARVLYDKSIENSLLSYIYSVLRIRPGIDATPGTGYEGRVQFGSGENDASLKIGPVYGNDSGTYRCMVSISDENGGTQYAETELLVEG